MPSRTKNTVERYKAQIREEWTNPEIIAAYRKWGDHEAAWASAARDLICEWARLEPGLTVLDLASGHGEPALAAAERVGPSGRVTATDQASGLLEIAEERAREAGLETLTFRTADAHQLPFPDGTFDRVTCRLGLMYFPDPPTALSEAKRVLKPEGCATYLVWGPREQPLFDICLGLLSKYREPPADDPDAPTPFAFAEKGALTAALTEVGFAEVEEAHVTIPSPFPGSPQEFWDWFVDMAPPFKPLIASLPAEDKDRFLDEVLGRLEEHHDGSTVDIPIDVVVGRGTRP